MKKSEFMTKQSTLFRITQTDLYHPPPGDMFFWFETELYQPQPTTWEHSSSFAI